MDQIHDEFEAEHLYSQLQGLNWELRGLNVKVAVFEKLQNYRLYIRTVYIYICYTTSLYYERFIYQEVHIIPTYTYKCTSTLRISIRSSGFCKNEGSLLEGSIQMVPVKVPFIQVSTSTTWTFLSEEKGSGQL